MRIKTPRNHESGQVLPLLALALVGLLGFAALALDGGNLYTEQRRAQAAADNAVMAAAFVEMSDSTTTPAQWAAAAYANAARNGYNIGGPGTTLAFHTPPTHGFYAGNSHYMEVVITQTVPTSLAHLVYRQNPIPLTVVAIAHGLPSGPIMPGYALVAMKKECDNSNSTIYMDADGGGRSGGVYLTDGGAFVNAACPNALDAHGNHDGIVTDGPPINIAGTSYDGTVCTQAESEDPGSNCNFYPAPIPGATQVDQDPLASTPAGTPPDCRLLPSPDLATELNDPVGIHPGNYPTLAAGNHDMNMRPGIYCLNGGELSSHGTISGTGGVLIYMTVTATKIDLSGSGSVTMTAPSTATTGCTGVTDDRYDICKYLGILVYKVTGSNDCLANDSDIDFTGGSSMRVVGLIYAPYSLVRYGGGGSLYLEGQTIAGCVKFNGNGRIDIVYNPRETYGPPPSVTLDQ
jgi:Flp pilus assembly protein TadG